MPVERNLETCRLLYNWMLAERRENHTGLYEQKGVLVELKKREKYLRTVHSQVLQDVVVRLDKADHAFFLGLARRPRFKRKGGTTPSGTPNSEGSRSSGRR